jgi:hypothetical protein
MSHPFEHIDEKLRRADHHIAELEEEIVAFLNQPDLVNYDPAIVEEFRDKHHAREVPPKIKIISGEAIHQLRSALDHMICLFVNRHGGAVTNQTQFPVFLEQPVTKQKKDLFESQIRGIQPRSKVWALIQKHQPYRGRRRTDNHMLAILKKLNNDDKHKALLLQVVDVRQRTHVTVEDNEGWRTEAIFDQSGFTVEYIEEPVRVLDHHRRLSAFVAFPELGTRRNVDIVDELKLLAEYVASIVGEFRQHV